MLFIIIILICISIGSWICTYNLYKKDRYIIEINEERKQENQQLDYEVQLKKSELENIKLSVQTQTETLQSLNTTAETLKATAEQRAEEAYNNKVSALQIEYEQQEQRLKQELQSRSQIALDKISKEEEKLSQLQAKQLAYIKSQLRQEEISSNKDYYRLVIGDIDLDDIKMLRELQLRFSKKEIIDKLIWETYYKPAYDILMSHLFNSQNKVCGIYKITDLLSGQAYIGQSVDIKERFRQHIKASLTYGGATNKLYQLMQKSGPHNFTFEILEEVKRTQLNERETYWIDFYKTKEYGLNSTRGGS